MPEGSGRVWLQNPEVWAHIEPARPISDNFGDFRCFFVFRGFIGFRGVIFLGSIPKLGECFAPHRRFDRQDPSFEFFKFPRRVLRTLLSAVQRVPHVREFQYAHVARSTLTI